MPPAVDRSPSSRSSPLSGRRIISRIASPFTSKSRSIADFSIDVDDPHKQYSPGDVVAGSVRLRVLKPSRVTHLVVCLHGFAQVYKNPGSPGEGFRANNGYIGTGRGKKSGEYFGNGFASLFEDEIVLCGDGRLADGSYQFNFELQFPDRDLPSSIDFERGTVTYMITATMTRPTTMSPSLTCDRKIYMVETIDISPLYPPKIRTITLEALSKRSRARHQARKLVDAGSRKAGSTQQSEEYRDSMTQGVSAESETPLSPAPSEISFDSLESSNGRSSLRDSSRPSPGGSDGSNITTTTKRITATVESLQGGCLRGDNMAIKVNVKHVKPIKSLYGVIVTLYRQARVDMHPAIPLGPMEKGTERKYEDYYPKSVTGLGGLSLSGAGSSHLFRKDLAQVMVPLYVDPGKLTAEVTARVRIPDEAFPTISSVPGAMIGFRYFAEVLVDVQGKLANQDRNVAGLNLNNARPQMGASDSGEQPMAAPFGSTVIDTAPIRRDKGLVTCTFEIIVGTRDSDRKKGKRKMEPVAEDETPQTPSQPPHEPQAYQQATSEGTDSRWQVQASTYQAPEWLQQNDYLAYDHPPADNREHFDHYAANYDEPPPAIPMPHVPDESDMSEKERIQQAESRLLPSEPPGQSTDSSGLAEATAPFLGEGRAPDTSWQDAAAGVRPSSDLGPAISYTGSSHSNIPVSAPAYQEASGGASMHVNGYQTEDKQELQRQQLESEASAPPEEDITQAEAGAPCVPTEGEAFGLSLENLDSHADAVASSDLPRYER